MRAATRKILKVGVALVAVEATSLCGIWKDSASTIAGYENAKHSALAVIVPQIRPYLNKINLPKLEVPDFQLADKWNYGVTKSLSAVAAAPSKVAEFLTFPGTKYGPNSKASVGSVTSKDGDSHGNSSLKTDVKNLAEAAKDAAKSLVDHKPEVHSHLVPVNPHLPKPASPSPTETLAPASASKAGVPPLAAPTNPSKDNVKDPKATSAAKPDDKTPH